MFVMDQDSSVSCCSLSAPPSAQSSCGERRPLLDQGHDLGPDGLIRNPYQQAAAVTIPK